uniref:ATPase AAA-type core domain-containing protein n=1 Tax=Candidatus Kentrum sp. DK TaxID=2126562 RepID=A0A450SDE1_9GAMM|nr:MAG: hypothetical protein BECKDK2373C_GA0170839_102924 [Candidatus Kentron sp. DK]
MLIEFVVSNYRSIRDEQRLTLVAGSDKNLRESNVFEMSSGKKKPLRLLRSAVVYGANASGKSNLIKAMATMRGIVLGKDKELLRGMGERPPIEPFLFDLKARTQPTLFEIMVMVNDVRYQYGFTATAKRIYDEWLFAFPKGRGQRWFEREFFPEEGREEFTFGNNLTGDREVWRRATRHDALFLSTAVQLNSKQLQPLFNWFRNELQIIGLDGWDSSQSVEWCQDENKQRILTFLQAADFAISDLQVVNPDYAFDALIRNNLGRFSFRYFLPRKKIETEKDFSEHSRILLTIHRDNDGKVFELDMGHESDGTQKMFHLAAPWLDALDQGRVLFVDELHDNLHPWLVQFLVRFFHSGETNPLGAQLIFTTHETAILSDEYLRRDQIWFCERNRDQSSRLYSLGDFRSSKGVENFTQDYLVGCYGAVPFVDEPPKVPGS